MTKATHEGIGRAAHRRHHRACGHEWHLVADDVDEFGRVRKFECHKCGDVHFT